MGWFQICSTSHVFIPNLLDLLGSFTPETIPIQRVPMGIDDRAERSDLFGSIRIGNAYLVIGHVYLLQVDLGTA